MAEDFIHLVPEDAEFEVRHRTGSLARVTPDVPKQGEVLVSLIFGRLGLILRWESTPKNVAGSSSSSVSLGIFVSHVRKGRTRLLLLPPSKAAQIFVLNLRNHATVICIAGAGEQ